MNFGQLFRGVNSQRSDSGTRAARSSGRGHLVFSNGMGDMECIVLDYSQKGAKLRPNDINSVPKFFELHLAGGEASLCELTHRKSDHVIVRFIPSNV